MGEWLIGTSAGCVVAFLMGWFGPRVLDRIFGEWKP